MMSRLATSPLLRELWRIAPAPLSLSAAGRAAVATGGPLLLAHLAQRPELFWMATGGFLSTLVDRGGGYRDRATNLAAVAAAIAAAGAAAALAGHQTLPAVAGMLIWGGAVSFLRIYGVTGANVGLTSSVVFAVSLGTPLAPLAALERGAWLLAGGGWAAVLALLIWPLRPQLPARLAVGRCYRALGGYATEIEQLAKRGVGEHGSAGRYFDAVRRALEDGWSALGGGWSAFPQHGRARHDRLVVLLETAEQMLGTLVALSDVTERLPDIAARSPVVADLRKLAAYTDRLAHAVEREEREPPGPPTWGTSALQFAMRADFEDASLRHAERMLSTLRDLCEAAGEVVAGSHAVGEHIHSPRVDALDHRGWLDPVRANLSSDSILLRHALRIGVTTALAVVVARTFQLQLGHWITLTVVFVLQPNVGTTLVKTVQRVLGTALGAIAAALLPLLVHGPALLLPVLSVLAAAAVVTLPINYTLFTFFVTPTFVVLTELQTGVSGLAGERLLNTLIGGVLAVAGTRLIWSLPERRLFPAHAAVALHTARNFLRAVAVAPHPPLADPDVAALRRKLGLEIINAGESLHRLSIEGGGAENALESGNTLLVYLRRLTSASVSLATASPPSPAESDAVLRFLAGAEDALVTIAHALAEGRTPPALPSLIDRDWPPRLRADLERIDGPLRVLHQTAQRLAPGEIG